MLEHVPLGRMQGAAATSQEGLQLEFEAFRAEAEAKQARLRQDIQRCRDEAAAEMQGLRDLNATMAGRSNLHQVGCRLYPWPGTCFACQRQFVHRQKIATTQCLLFMVLQ